MATRKSSTADTERLDDSSIERVIELLDNKGTKKDACDILGIKYNTTRLASIIEKYKDKKANEAIRRAEKRGTPATEGELTYIVSSYLEGESIDVIANSLYRSRIFVVNVLNNLKVPIRRTSWSYFKPSLIPDEATKDTFSVGELVYSARYDSLATIRSEFSPGVYNIWLISDKWQQFAYQPNYELASLNHLEKYLTNVKRK